MTIYFVSIVLSLIAFLLFNTIPVILKIPIFLFISLLFVINCDNNAYVFGKRFGKTQFHKMSPNKTMEGYYHGIWGPITVW